MRSSSNVVGEEWENDEGGGGGVGGGNGGGDGSGNGGADGVCGVAVEVKIGAVNGFSDGFGVHGEDFESEADRKRKIRNARRREQRAAKRKQIKLEKQMMAQQMRREEELSANKTITTTMTMIATTTTATTSTTPETMMMMTTTTTPALSKVQKTDNDPVDDAMSKIKNNLLPTSMVAAEEKSVGVVGDGGGGCDGGGSGGGSGSSGSGNAGALNDASIALKLTVVSQNTRCLKHFVRVFLTDKATDLQTARHTIRPIHI